MGGLSSKAADGGAAGAPSPSGGCPVIHKKPAQDATAASGDVCPVKYKNPNAYNVYGQKIDPDNMMPATAQQMPAPGQTEPLSTDRVVSGIARGGMDSTWVYPSEQMFYNALQRKGKGSDVQENHVSKMVAIHNNMNEKTWRQLLMWERLHCKECNDPRLLRFTGRPDELSPKARLKTMMGYPAPFDRHDWIVDRCGKEVRYIIDYYHDEALPVDQRLPGQFNFNSNTQITLDVRTAIDSPEAFKDRVQMGLLKILGGEPPAPENWPASLQKLDEEKSKDRYDQSKAGWNRQQRKFMEKFNAMHEKCKGRLDDLRTCNSEEDCLKKTMAKDICIGEMVCPKEVSSFMQALEKGSEADMETSYAKVVDCTTKFKEEGEKLFQK